jgi:hypothetical protein
MLDPLPAPPKRAEPAPPAHREPRFPVRANRAARGVRAALCAIAALALPAVVVAQAAPADRAPAPAAAPADRPPTDRAPAAGSADPAPMTRAEERSYRRQLEDERERLESALSRVTERTGFAAAIEAQGYRIASLNADEPDYLEFEIVKGRASHEVRIEFDPKSKKVRDLDVDRNLWLSDTAERMLEDPNYVAAAPLAPARDAGSSDRTRIDAWDDEKDRLEKLLQGRDVATIPDELRKAGYEITSTNDREAGYIEFEIARGENSFEVQIDVDRSSRRAEDVDVTSNLWKARSTREARGSAR